VPLAQTKTARANRILARTAWWLRTEIIARKSLNRVYHPDRGRGTYRARREDAQYLGNAAGWRRGLTYR